MTHVKAYFKNGTTTVEFDLAEEPAVLAAKAATPAVWTIDRPDGSYTVLNGDEVHVWEFTPKPEKSK